VCVNMCMCVCVCEREKVCYVLRPLKVKRRFCVRARLCVCVREREEKCVCVYVCGYERARVWIRQGGCASVSLVIFATSFALCVFVCMWVFV